MFKKIGKVGASLAVLVAVAVGASSIAGAASGGSTSTSASSTTQAVPSQNGYGPPPRGQGPPGGGRQHKPETALTGDTAAKVKQAALDRVSGGSIIRVENDSDSSSPYEAHVKKSDGTQVVVLVNKQFKAPP